jgi:hypothetical protein
MKTIFTLDTWKLFLIILTPILFPDNIVGLILIILILAVFATWTYFLGTELYNKLPGGHTLNINKFKFHFFFPLIYFTIAIVATGGGYTISGDNIDQFGAIGYLMIILHIFSMYCMIYCIYFLSKALISVETQNKNIQTSEYIGYIFGFWFFPIGIWFIQPKIKQIFTDK